MQAQLDIQSHSEIEKFFYDDINSRTFFQKDTTKIHPFSFHPMTISTPENSSGSANFGYTATYTIPKTFDYLMNICLFVKLPDIELLPSNIHGENGRIRWTSNLFHNIIEECTLSFNELAAFSVDNFSMDFMAEFETDPSKKTQYMESIGNRDSLILPTTHLKSEMLILPLPMYFCKDVANAIPLSAMPYTNITLTVKFKPWENILIFENESFVNPKTFVPTLGKDIAIEPKIESFSVVGNFGTVFGPEKRQLTQPKYMLIEQITTLPRQLISNFNNTKINIPFKNSTKSVYFACRNATFKNVWSNYSNSNTNISNGIFNKGEYRQIIKSVGINYNNVTKVEELPSDYFRMITAYHGNQNIPEKNGLFVYNFCVKPTTFSGSTNLSRIQQPYIHFTFEENFANTNGTFELVVVGVYHSVIKINNGDVSFVSA